MTLENQTVIIVGGSSGIGLGVAEALLSEGATVTIVGRTPEKLRAAQEALGSPERVKAVAADVTQEKQVRALFEEVAAFDHLVVTRGMPPVVAPVASFDIDAVRRFVDLVLVSTISLAKHAAPGSVMAGQSRSRLGSPRTSHRSRAGPPSQPLRARWDISRGRWRSSSARRG